MKMMTMLKLTDHVPAVSSPLVLKTILTIADVLTIIHMLIMTILTMTTVTMT